MRKLRVAHIITRLTVGGAQENTIFTFLNHDSEKYDAFLICGADDSYGGREYWEILRIDPKVIMLDALQNQINPIKDIKVLIQIYIYIRRNKIDIVHTHSSKAGVLGRLAAKAAGVSVIVHTVHGWSFNDGMNKFRRWLYIWIERFTARLCHRLITVTNLDINKGLKVGIGSESKYTTIRSGVAFERFNDFDNEKVKSIRAGFEDKRIIGTIGRISEQKNLFDFVRIAEKLVSYRNDLHFVIIGDGPIRKQLEEYISSMGLKKNITFMGVRRDIDDLYGILDVLLMTSLWEGLPRVIPEAMFCGVPVVANSVDGVSEIIKNGVNGFTTVPHDLEDACCKIDKLLDDTELREMIVKNAYNTAYPEYEAFLMVQQIERLYESIFSEKSA